MEMYMDWAAEKDDCSITVDRFDDSISASDCIAYKPSLLGEIEDVNVPLSSLSSSLAVSSDVSDLSLVLHCAKSENSATAPPKGSIYFRKWDLATDGVYVPSSAAYNYLGDGKDLELWSSRCSADLQDGLKEKESFIILVDSLDEENLPPLLGKVLPYQCERCAKSFQDLRQLEEHKKKYVAGCSYWCPICGKEFFRAANLRMHKLTHSTDRPHKCPECSKGFIRTADVWRHLQSMHKIDRSSVVLGDANIKNPWSVLHQNQDQSCNSGQVRSASENPGEGGSKQYQCPVCGKAFSKANSLYKHKVIHKKEKPYQCNTCGKAFVQQVRLRRHHQTHTAERPFHCKDCGSVFKHPASLQRHRRNHTGEKPYSCAYCGQSFAELGTLRRHEGIHRVVQS
ncbi:zinc finger protein 625-like [Heteronotia binoei]|uniref:zinc finger protein 625-like n=1 Tax=Heteronotia binoei TaxID=13085 RepID=UPI0029317571|nr:zinc finger protein 625-like [Heteronotia binoei]XP_060089363.1 zinc finger protein 625-like [Heteronotia binoei]XP_060089364.1 zinc finger protein 625-like [Heteronotia binoei]XP_060089365.1 zinc finger protein 625-like [Heteronotia binoei]XP_060089366.1 zinc finger protein 625-like [Heteronotia binoei]XP_060089367.1 zinc finger protein 625-like [Heteronotia binoei]